MVDIGSVVTIVKTIRDLVVSIKDKSPSTEIQALAITLNSNILDLQGGICDLQSALSALQKENDELSKTIMEHSQWKETERRYQLTELSPRVYAYRYLVTDGSAEPEHYLCAQCFDRKEKSILQGSGNPTYFKCHICNSEVILHDQVKSFNPRVPKSSKWDHFI